MMRIQPDRIRYQRNGVHGAPFHAVAFRYGKRHLVAAVFEESGFCAVIEPANPRNAWRGDDFEPPLRAAIATADRSGESYDCSDVDNL